MQKYEEGQTVQSLVDRGAPTLVVMSVKRIPERTGIPENFMYQCDNGKWYSQNELGKYVNTTIQHHWV